MGKFKTSIFFIITMSLFFISCKNQRSETKSNTIKPVNEAHQLVIDMVEAVGGRERLLNLKDVEFTYIYHNLKSDLKDITTERYIFEGELSWARYEQRERFMPKDTGIVIQAYDGQNTFVSLDGKKVEDSKAIERADFTRKTNYYWLVMMYKLLDDGIIYEKMEDQIVEGQNYHRVKITYNKGVGDVQDIYLLYINPQTKLVDQFLFTVMDFDVTAPFLMTAEYEDIEGLKLMTHRKYRAANWEGEAITDLWSADIYSKDFKFNNGFKREGFSF